MLDARRWIALAALLSASSGPVPAARAQPDDAREASIPELALQWSLGHFASPLICQLGGEPVRGLRRIVIAAAPARVQPAANRIRFVDLEVAEASRCLTELGGDTPNVTGSVLIRLPGQKSSPSPQRDFREALKRGRGFEFAIVGGVLRIQAVTQPQSPPRAVDFEGGRAELREVAEGSDVARLLAPFRSPRKLLLELRARDGTSVSFPLYLSPPRR